MKRYSPHTVYERDNITVVIDRSTFVAKTQVFIFRHHTSMNYLLTSNGGWIELMDGETFPEATLKIDGDALLALRYALDEADPPSETISAALTGALALEQSRVDKLLDHVLEGKKR